ncbi:hypothetical protein RJT34_11440 [Clitoria ternatea]|uniref:Uncharacterized protein n=1 Tax=Clitoria ternatea TaxID=43366 RepID=A0AAN9JMI8_CLITE
MGTCLSKKKGSSTSPSSIAGPKSVSTAPTNQKTNSDNIVTVTLSKPTIQEKQDPEAAKQDETQMKKEIFIIKHRKSHDEKRERALKDTPCINAQQNNGPVTSEAPCEPMGNKIAMAPSTPSSMVMGVRTSSCTKEEVDAILIQCGRLSRSSSGRATASGRKYSGSKRSFDFDQCDNDANVSAEDEQRRETSEENDVGSHHHRQRHRQSPRRSSPSHGRRRTPSRERDQQNQQSSSRERRVSRSPGRRSSDISTTTSSANANNTNSRPGKMVSVPATVSSLVMDKSNNACGGGECGAMKRITVKRNVGDGGSRSAASPRAKSPARNVTSAKVLTENQQQQPSLSRNNSSRKTEQSPYRRNPLSEVDPNSLSYPQSNTNNANTKANNNKTKIEAEANQKQNGSVALEKGVSVNCKTKEQHKEEIKVASGVDNSNNLKQPQSLTRSRSSRRSRDLDINPETLVNPTQSYTSILLEDIQNFHQKNTQQQSSISLPACLTKVCSILDAVADLNSTTSTNFTEERKSPSTQQSTRNENNVQDGANKQGKRVVCGNKDPFIESEVVVSDDVMEPSLHKYVTVKRGGSLCGVDMEDQESSGSNSFTVSSSGQHHWGGISSSSWEPNSADSTDCWSSRDESSGMSCEAAKKKSLNNKRRECDHEHSSGIGRGRLGSNKGSVVVTGAATTT